LAPALHTPVWAVLPFVCYLLLIAVLPLFLGRFWEHSRNKLAENRRRVIRRGATEAVGPPAP
jgi:hypothetical protein